MDRRSFFGVAAALAAVGPCRSALGETPLAVTDFRGKPVALGRPARRIVCLIESALSGLYMLGASESIVGVPANVYTGDVAPHYARLDPRLATRTLPAPGNWDFVSIERVLALRPDLVIVWAHQREAIAALEAHGIPVYGVFIAGIADLHKEMRDFAILTGTPAQAERLLSYTDGEVARISRMVAVAAVERPKVHFAWSQGMLETSCRGSMVDDLIGLAGGRNICVEAREHATVSLERVLGASPDVIVLWPSSQRSVASVIADPQWRSTAAVRSHRVFQLPEVFDCDLWTLKFQYALRLMAGWFHPQRLPLAGDAERSAMMASLYGHA